jgi:phosphoglycolate phosphatase-like HAD superfamily hydrolase
MAEQNGKGPVAALFDVDGTLVDTNYLHAVTWWEAFTQAGYQVPMARIHRAIGMGSGQMLDRLLPADRDKDADVRAAHSALDKIGVPAGEAVFTGDTVWDVQACQKAGVPCIGVLSGGVSRDELTSAGAAEVYRDPAGLLAALDGSLLGSVGETA